MNVFNGAFTDEDLKRLKDKDGHYMTRLNYTDYIAVDKLEALLHRLEAVERCIDVVAGCCDCLNSSSDGEEALKAWRKAAGKEGL